MNHIQQPLGFFRREPSVSDDLLMKGDHGCPTDLTRLVASQRIWRSGRFGGCANRRSLFVPFEKQRATNPPVAVGHVDGPARICGSLVGVEHAISLRVLDGQPVGEGREPLHALARVPLRFGYSDS